MQTVTRAIALVLMCAPLAYAQQQPPPPGTDKPTAPAVAEEKAPVPRPPVTSTRFEIMITDSGGGQPITKTVSLNVSSFGSGSIRSTGTIPGPDPNRAIGSKPVPLNVDVRNVQPQADGQIVATIVIEYQPYVENAPRLPSLVTASSTAAFANGQKTMILQAADPMSDRRTTIEVTATRLK